VTSVEHARRSSAPVRLRIRVAPGAQCSKVVGRHGDGWKLRVQAAPERGKANKEVVAVLAEALGVTRHNVRVIAGHTARDKVVELDRLPLEEAERRLSSAEARA
jgi:hypothetical protein